MGIQEIGFGDFCTIEQKRYVGPNEFYGYKVVGRKKSNVWTDVPVDANNGKETRHDYMDDVVTVVCNNLDDRTVYQFRVSDLASVKKAQAVPEGFVLIRDDTKTVVAIERMVEQQVEASGMDSRRLERLDGWKIIEAAVKAQESTND